MRQKFAQQGRLAYMKNIFLGLTLLASTQIVDVSAKAHQFENVAIEQANEFTLNRSHSHSHGHHNDKILPPVGATITSTSGAAIFANGSVVSETTSSTLTVLNSSQGLARISIGSSFGPHEFLIGQVGDKYFGTSVDKEGTIILQRVSKRVLEVTFTRLIGTNGLPLQVRLEFSL
jgi:hypothetical protein